MLFNNLVAATIMLLLKTVIVSAAPSPDEIHKRTLTFPYGSTKVRGVNLGGWFVLEPWITPSMFQGAGAGAVDEHSLCRLLGKSPCLAKLRSHWATFYTAADFHAIAAAGLNHVRIPVGYWAVSPLSGDPFVQGQLAYLDNAITWAGAAKLKVWIDLHGAPGSQNGFDNSGLRDHIEWQSGAGNVQHTVDVIATLSKRYSQASFNNVVVGIQLLNEPLGPNLNMDGVRQYWTDGYAAVRKTNGVAVVIHDAFQPITSWNGFMKSGFNNVILDTHQYQVFSPEQVAMSIDSHVSAACSLGKQIAASDKWTVVGEWSGARTDCAKWLNGVGRGTRYEGTFSGTKVLGNCARRAAGSISQFPLSEQQKTRRFIEAQLDAYEQGAGWIFWTWKTEQGAPEWELRDLLKNGVFPNPVTARKYPYQCSF